MSDVGTLHLALSRVLAAGMEGVEINKGTSWATDKPGKVVMAFCITRWLKYSHNWKEIHVFSPDCFRSLSPSLNILTSRLGSSASCPISTQVYYVR